MTNTLTTEARLDAIEAAQDQLDRRFTALSGQLDTQLAALSAELAELVAIVAAKKAQRERVG